MLNGASDNMKAMVLSKVGEPLRLKSIPKPSIGDNQLLLRVNACGICRTDLHVVDGDLPQPALPLVPGHQIVGRVEELGVAVNGFQRSQRVGVPWLGGSCGHCEFCIRQEENLCDNAVYTGYQVDGGFAEFCAADARYCFALPETYADEQVAPLLCAGLIGYRAWRPVRDAKAVGFYGFGAAAHILIQLATSIGQRVFAFTRAGDKEAQAFARQLGAVWAGDSHADPGESLDAAILFAPVGQLVPESLRRVRKGGTVVCAGIHMSDIPSFPYSLLWGERKVQSVANLTRADGEEFLPLAAAIPIRTEVTVYTLDRVNEALGDLREGRFVGAAVIKP